MTKNRYEDPTQRLQSHNWSQEYKDNYDKIFGKKETWLDRKEREQRKAQLSKCPAYPRPCACTGACKK